MKLAEETFWTTDYLIGELHYYLESYKDERKIRRYEMQAKDLLYRIPVYHPTPYYVVYKNDLTERLNKELQSYRANERNELLKISVGRIFENINERYFIQSVKRLLRVELRG